MWGRCGRKWACAGAGLLVVHLNMHTGVGVGGLSAWELEGSVGPVQTTAKAGQGRPG